MTLSKELLDKLACPDCKGDLTYDPEKNQLICQKSKQVYRIEDDIPVLLVDEAEPLVE